MHQNQNPQQSSSPQKDYGYRADQPLGDILRQERERYGWTLQQVEDVLRIRASQLRALEDGRLDLLPGRVYAIGFVRSYAACLGLNPEDAVRLFKAQYTGNSYVRPELNFPVPASESKLPNWKILSGAAAALFVLGTAILLLSGNDPSQNRAHQEVPTVPQDLASLAAGDGTLYSAYERAQNDVQAVMDWQDSVALNNLTTAAGTAGEEVMAPSPSPIVITAHENVWLEIRRADGSVLLSRVLKEGDRYSVPEDEEGLIFDTGNIAGLSFALGDETIQPAGRRGDVRRKVALTHESLRALAQEN